VSSQAPESQIHKIARNKQVNLLTSRAWISVYSMLLFDMSGQQKLMCVTAGDSQHSTSVNPSKIIAEARGQQFQRGFVLEIYFLL
jgi:hypothetical protein